MLVIFARTFSYIAIISKAFELQIKKIAAGDANASKVWSSTFNAILLNEKLHDLVIPLVRGGYHLEKSSFLIRQTRT